MLYWVLANHRLIVSVYCLIALGRKFIFDLYWLLYHCYSACSLLLWIQLICWKYIDFLVDPSCLSYYYHQFFCEFIRSTVSVSIDLLLVFVWFILGKKEGLSDLLILVIHFFALLPHCASLLYIWDLWVLYLLLLYSISDWISDCYFDYLGIQIILWYFSILDYLFACHFSRVGGILLNFLDWKGRGTYWSILCVGFDDSRDTWSRYSDDLLFL